MHVTTLQSWLLRLWQVLRDDVRRFYSRRNLARLGIGLLVGGMLANSSLDQRLEDAFQRHLHADSQAATRFHWVTKQFGDRRVAIFIPLAAMAISVVTPPNPATAAAGVWGAQMARALVIASPITFGGMWLLGGDRPSEGNGSEWRPWQKKDHGISGHAMAGALPFLIMAGITSHPIAQTVLYACSGLTAFSRLDTRSHYPSQVLIGWWLAFLAFRTVRAGRKPAAAADRANPGKTGPTKG